MSEAPRLFRPKLPGQEIYSGDILTAKVGGQFNDYLIYYGTDNYRFYFKRTDETFGIMEVEGVAWWWKSITYESEGIEKRFVAACLLNPKIIGGESARARVIGSVDDIPEKYDPVLRGRVNLIAHKLPPEALAERETEIDV